MPQLTLATGIEHENCIRMLLSQSSGACGNGAVLGSVTGRHPVKSMRMARRGSSDVRMDLQT